MAGMAGGPGGTHAVNLLPGPLCAVMVLGYLLILVNHLRHALDTSGQRRIWHLVHVAMALGMGYMFMPAATGRPEIADGFWQAVYGCALLLVVAALAAQLLLRRGASGLWLLLAVDLAAMVYMWSPTELAPALSWLLAAFLILEAALWASGRVVQIDRNWLPDAGYRPQGGGGAGVLHVAATARLACERDLRVSMSAMTFGMAYMLVAMQVMH